ncbi:phage tail length tape measure family protein [Acetobacter senegalensis]|uniref:phage tail length tape measure family protein n=1 Tax=Acetobacter senegalensis TaxID=446692 RepID=UPI00128B886B|nr:phage tail length tape measure family protein [Acetobacter senegalensis]MPQ75076.1 phage tail protein [Acetobacter senegalensis]
MPNEESLRISYASNVAGLVEKDAAALEKLGDVAEVTERKITKTSRTVSGDARKFDDVTKATNALQRALKDLADTEDRQNSALAAGDVTAEEYTRTMAGAERAVQKAVENLAKAEAQWSAYNAAQAEAAKGGSSAALSFDTLTAAQSAQLLSMRDVTAQFRAGQITVQDYRAALHDIAASYATLGTAAEAATHQMASGLQSHIDNVTGVSSGSADTSDKQADFEAAAEAADKLRAKWVPLARAEQDYAKSQQELNTLLRAGILDLGEYEASMARITSAYQAQKMAIVSTAQAQQDALRTQNETTAAGAQGKINAWAGVSTPEYGQADTRQADFEAAAQDAEKLRAQLVPLAAAQQEYAEAQEKAGAALAANIISQQEYDAYVGKAKTTLDRQTASLSGNAGAAKLTAFEMGILADEAHKFFDQVLAGGNAMQAAFYQVPNMVQIMGGFRASLTRVTSALIGPGALVAGLGAGVAAIAAMGYASESEQQQLAQLSTHLRATRTDYADMATAAEKAARSLHESDSDLSLSDSRTAVQTIVSVPTVDSSQIERYMTDARNLAAIMGQTVPEAAKTMASALQDPAKAAEEFAQQGMPGFNAGLVLMVQHMEQAGNRTGALNSVLKVLEQTTKNAEEQALTPFQASLKNLKDETGGVGDAVVYSFQHMGDGIVGMATAGIKGLTGLIELIEQIAPQVETATKSIWDSVASGMKWVGGKLEGGVEGGLNLLGATNLSHLMAQGTTADPQFSMPNNPATSGMSGVSSSTINESASALDKLSASTTKNTAAWEENRKEIDAMAGTDSSLGGQISDHQRKIEGLTSAIAKLKALGPANYSDGNAEAYNATLKNLTGQLQAEQVALGGLRGPFAELLEQQDRAAQSAAALTGYDKAMVEASQQADDAARQLSGGLASASEKALVQAAAARTLAAEYTTGTAVMLRNTSLQGQIADAWSRGGAAAEHATNYVQAYTDALDHYKEGSPAFAEAVAQRTKALDEQYSAAQKVQLAQQTYANDNQVKLLETETDTIGMNADARTKLINRMQAEQEQLQKGNSLQDESVQKYLESVDALSDSTAAYQHHQQVVQDVTGSLENMTDQLTDGITQGFLQGTSSGMSFKSVLKGIEVQIAAMLVKMALINPLLNKIDGGTRTTMDDITKMFSQQQNGSASTSSDSSWAPTASSDAMNSVYANDNTGSASSSSFSSDWAPTVSGSTSLFSNTESHGGLSSSGQATASNGISVSDIQSIFGSGSSSSSKTSSGFGSLSDMFSGDGGLMSDSGQETASTAGGAMSLVGGAVGGLTTGYSLGKKASNLTGGGEGGKIGAAVGAGIGTVVGSVFGGPIGGMIGGAVLGTIGGIIGGLFNKTHRVYDSVIGSDGQLAIGGTRSKNAKDDVTAGLTTDLDSVNAAYADAGITVSDGSYGEVGHYHKGKKHRSTALTDLLPDITLHSDDANEDLALQQLMPKSFDSISSYTQTIESIKQLADTLDALHVSVAKFDDQTHVTVGHISGYTGDLGKVLSGFDGKTVSTDALENQISTLKELLDITNNGAQSLVSQVADLRDKYQQAADQAKAYGLDYQVILDKGNAVAQQMLDAENTKLTQSDQSVQGRYLAAVGDQEGADLVNFDVSADQQRQSLQDEWRSYLGDSFADNQTYAAQMADLDKTLAAERLKIQTTYADQALAAQQQAEQAAAEKQAEYLSQAQSSVASAFSNLADYVQGLGTSDASPLSVQDQYKLANDNFDTDYQAAMGGDYDALTRLQSESQIALSVDKQWLGSSTDYSNAYQDMLTKLQAIGNLGADTFTANLAKQLAAQQVDATLQVKQSIQTMQAAITAELKQFIRVQTVKAA